MLFPLSVLEVVTTLFRTTYMHLCLNYVSFFLSSKVLRVCTWYLLPLGWDMAVGKTSDASWSETDSYWAVTSETSPGGSLSSMWSQWWTQWQWHWLYWFIYSGLSWFACNLYSAILVVNCLHYSWVLFLLLCIIVNAVFLTLRAFLPVLLKYCTVGEDNPQNSVASLI